MSCLNLNLNSRMPKQLKQLPSSSKKAWKSFTCSLDQHIHPKLRNLHHHLRIPKSVAKTAHRLLRLRPKLGPGFTTRKGGARHSYNSYYRKYQYQQFQPSASVPNSPATVYVDRLFGPESSSSSSSKTGTTRSATRVSDHATASRSQSQSQSRSQSVKWKEYVSSLPPIRGVDERAEEFISKFREEMQLQREQSLLEFQQMLARTA